MAKSKSLRAAYGEAPVEFGAKNDKVAIMDADLAHATVTSTLAAKCPDRFFNFSIAKANMVRGAAGFAYSGLLLFVSTFVLFGADRAYEQIHNSINCVSANVKFGSSHSGLCVGEGGGSHQPTEDIALMRVLPDMTIFVPCDAVEMKKAVLAATGIDGPVYIRVARPVCDILTKEFDPFIPGKANVLRDGGDVCVIAAGLMTPEALKAAESLKKSGVSAVVINMHAIKPINNEIILTMAGKCGAIVTTEEHSIIDGLGSAVAEVLAGRSAARFARVGIQGKFGQSGKPADLFKACGLITENIAETCRMTLK